MLLHCKKAKLFITGEVFPLDIGLLMGAECYNFPSKGTYLIYCIIHPRKSPSEFLLRGFIDLKNISTPMDMYTTDL